MFLEGVDQNNFLERYEIDGKEQWEVVEYSGE